MSIPVGTKKNYTTLMRAIKNGDFCLLECKRKRDGAVVHMICALNRAQTNMRFAPLAEMITGNPYEDYLPPNPDGGFFSDKGG